MNALSIFIASLGAALVMLSGFGILLLRRWYQEKREHRERGQLGAITRSYLRRVSGQIDEEASALWSDELKLAAVSHIHMLLRGGDRHRLMQLAELDGLLRATLRQSRSLRASRRIDAIRLLQQFGSEACIARLREIFTRDRDQTTRLEAAFALAAIGALPPPRETIRILGMFDRRTNQLDSALLRASAPEYAEQLILILDDHLTDEKRALVIDALGWSGEPSVLPILERTARSPNPELRSAAARAAARLGYPSAGDWIISLLQDPTAFVRVQAVNSCAALGLAASAPALSAALKDENIWVRLRAEHALGVLNSYWQSDETRGLLA